MKHLGDITKISGYDVPIVDCVIGGSPCQDLSLAGKRAGLDGERSGLFMEQVRIVKEMREHDKRYGKTNESIRPRFMVWENVPGAFSSNKGQDFRVVLEEIAKVAEVEAVIPMPPKNKWTTSGCIVGDGWSIAWRVLDAQFWGVPQRRRRIALVADFGGECAEEILFVRNGLQGDSSQSREKRQGASEDAEGCIASDDSKGSRVVIALDRETYNCGQNFARTPGIYEDGINPTIVSRGPSAVCYVVGIDCYNQALTGDVAKSLTNRATDSDHVPCVVMHQEAIVRRLTPLECERLQGYPDLWTDIGEYTDSNGKKKKSADASRYKALGNSIALPPWKWVLKRICSHYERDATMASLFDGIGGFPIIWEQLNGKGTCLWASEIEEFPMAVTAKRICER